MSGQNTPGNDLLGDPNSRTKKLSLTDRIATLERENANLRLSSETWEALATTLQNFLDVEKTLRAFDAALQPKEPPVQHVLTADEWAKWKALYAAMHLGTEHVRRFQMGSTADIALDAIDGGTFNAELAT